MRIVKKILLVILVLISIPLIAAIFIKKDYSVERSVVIAKPKQDVFNYVKYVKNQEQFNVWSIKDPAAIHTYEGTDGTPGFTGRWESEEVGKGEQKIIAIEEGNKIDLGLHFIEPFEGDAQSRITTETTEGNKTRVSWKMEGRSKYPMNVMNLFIDNVLGGDLEKSLGNLKVRCEIRP